LEKLNDAELDSALSEISIIARATPASKLRVVERMVKKGEIVAVTGDGVNDAPALKKAHVGVVMGKTGTEVSKSVADLILMDDNFATLEKAIEYGRVITNNIISFLRFQITTNIALVLLSLPYVMGIKIFDPIQILWINLLIDGPPALTLGLEKPSKSTMKDKPKKRTTFINPHFISTTLNMAFYMTAISLLLFFYYSNSNPVNATAATFTAFVFMQLFNALNSRSKSQPFHSKLLSNPWMVITLLSVAALQISIISIQPLKEFFRIADASLSNVDLIIAIAAGSTVLILGEATKYFRRKHLGFSPSL
ncbi:HAD-IC family P-type ATPase, partial [Candidatus Micrarchaeota archaeon]|nr:HAD-IC family P-type ATPase [Candidatus Micrarchaeota archaeon]